MFWSCFFISVIALALSEDFLANPLCQYSCLCIPQQGIYCHGVEITDFKDLNQQNFAQLFPEIQVSESIFRPGAITCQMFIYGETLTLINIPTCPRIRSKLAKCRESPKVR